MRRCGETVAAANKTPKTRRHLRHLPIAAIFLMLPRVRQVWNLLPPQVVVNGSLGRPIDADWLPTVCLE